MDNDETITLTEKSEQIVKRVELTSQSVHLVARNREEMAQCQSVLSEWLKHKIAAESDRAKELKENLDLAIKNKWRTVTLKKHVQLAKNTVTYYKKMKEAVDSGYAIIPDLPVHTFAIRVENALDTPKATEPTQISDKNLPVGSGEYVSDQAQGYEKTWITGKEGVDLRQHWAFVPMNYQEISFPLIAVKPEVMNEASEAMKHKIFDSIGIFLPATEKATSRPSSGTRYLDPMIVGKIIGPKKYRHARQTVCCFLIAWFLDLRTL